MKMYRYSILFKMYFFHSFRILRWEILNLLVKNTSISIHSDNSLAAAYAHLLQEYFAIFRNYTLCQNCKTHCCYYRENRFDFNDCYIYGYPLSNGKSSMYTIKRFLWLIPRGIKYVATGVKPSAPQECCEHYSEKGCLLSVEKRAAFCLSSVCLEFIMNMSNADAKNYSKLLIKDFLLQNRIFWILVKDIIKTKHTAKTR